MTKKRKFQFELLYTTTAYLTVSADDEKAANKELARVCELPPDAVTSEGYRIRNTIEVKSK